MSTVSITTEKVGTRIYVTGNTYPVKDRLKTAGCHWDGDRKQWWIGAAKADAIKGIVDGIDGQDVPEPAKDLSGKEVHGKVEYKGRAYYVIGESKDGGRLWLTVLNGSIDFWADVAACKWVKRYEAREQFGGYRRGTIWVRQTLSSIQRFVEKNKGENKKSYSDGGEYCYDRCPVTGQKCCPENGPCHDCQ